MNYINIAWTCGALGYIIYAQTDGNWVHHVAYFSGASISVLSVFFWLLQSPPAELDPLMQPFGKKASAI